jgi:hypothetical protein
MAEAAPAPRVSGTVILDQIALMREVYGADTVDRSIASLPLDLKKEVDTLLRGGWCSVRMAYELKKAVAERTHEELLDLQRRIVRLAIERTLTTFWRFLMRQLTDKMLAKRAPMLYSKSFDRGAMELTTLRDGGASLELTGWPEIPHFDLVGLMVGVETVFSLAGRKEPRVDSVRKDGKILLEVKWLA